MAFQVDIFAQELSTKSENQVSEWQIKRLNTFSKGF